MNKLISFVVLGLLALSSSSAHAGVFNIPRFVEPGKMALGAEPEVTLTNGAGLGLNLKYTHGLTDLLNIQGEVGGGFGTWNLRVASTLVIDFFPDIDKQPGIGLGVQLKYMLLPALQSMVHVTALPYIHKAFDVEGYEIDPFLSIPMGMSFSNGRYLFIGTAALGVLFKPIEHWRFNLEVGIGWLHIDSYLSTGATYYF